MNPNTVGFYVLFIRVSVISLAHRISSKTLRTFKTFVFQKLVVIEL